MSSSPAQNNWLQGNRRAILLGGIPVILLFVLGIAPWLVPSAGTLGYLVRGFGCALILLGLLAAATLARQLNLPRVACDGENLLLYVLGTKPVSVPLHVVECFFLGQGPSGLPAKQLEEAETSNVIVRLAERAVEWHQHETRATFANWCDGYVTIKGAWCEQITEDKLRELNSKLAQAKRDLKATS